jgi:hypothetical protein
MGGGNRILGVHQNSIEIRYRIFAQRTRTILQINSLSSVVAGQAVRDLSDQFAAGGKLKISARRST